MNNNRKVNVHVKRSYRIRQGKFIAGNYARIEGTHTGIVRQEGVDTWQAFSKYSYTISSLGLSGVYTDSSY